VAVRLVLEDKDGKGVGAHFMLAYHASPQKGQQKTPGPAGRCVRSFFFFLFFSTYLGVSRQGEFENTGTKLSTFLKSSPGKNFSGVGISFTFFLPNFFIALVKRLSVRGTQKHDYKIFTGSCV
jgi:hypothetical protein